MEVKGASSLTEGEESMSTTASQAEHYLQISVLSKMLYDLLKTVPNYYGGSLYLPQECPFDQVTVSNALHDLSSLSRFAEEQQQD